MKKTIFITGCSSGIGLATASYFFDQGWNVIATMRDPEKRKTPLHEKGLPDLVALDVTDGASIQSAVEYAITKYQRIDALVNNAGYALYGPFEASSRDQIEKQFETNVFGLMEVTRAVVPYFRVQKDGVLVNVSSMGGRIGFPLYSLYNATKWAVEGFSESIQYELRSQNIRVKLIEPGVIKTDFYGRSMDKKAEDFTSQDYAEILKRAQEKLEEGGMAAGTEPMLVAKTIFKAVNDPSNRLRYRVGADAQLVNFIRSIFPQRLFFKVLEKFMLG